MVDDQARLLPNQRGKEAMASKEVMTSKKIHGETVQSVLILL